MDTSALIKLQDLVDRYTFKKKIPMDDWALYMEHAADCVRELSTHHMRAYKTAKVHSVSSGIFDMPSDMQDIIALSTPYNGVLWTLTEKGIIDTMTIEGYPELEVDSGLVLFENFLDRESFINRGGSLGGNPTFSSPSIAFDGTDDYAEIPVHLDGTYTIVIKLTPDGVTDLQYVLDFGKDTGEGYITISAAAMSASTGTNYVNSVATSVITAAATYYVVSGITVLADTMVIGRAYTDTAYYDGSIDYIAIYDGTWDTTKIASGYSADSSIAETSAESILDYKTTDYGARGGNNTYYYLPDWKRRKIFLNGIPTDTVILQYISSGLSLTGDTYVPAQAAPVVDAYLRWMQADIDGGGINERRDRERVYKEALMMFRRTILPSAQQFKDALLSITTQSPIR